MDGAVALHLGVGDPVVLEGGEVLPGDGEAELAGVRIVPQFQNTGPIQVRGDPSVRRLGGSESGQESGQVFLGEFRELGRPGLRCLRGRGFGGFLLVTLLGDGLLSDLGFDRGIRVGEDRGGRCATRARLCGRGGRLCSIGGRV